MLTASVPSPSGGEISPRRWHPQWELPIDVSVAGQVELKERKKHSDLPRLQSSTGSRNPVIRSEIRLCLSQQNNVPQEYAVKHSVRPDEENASCFLRQGIRGVFDAVVTARETRQRISAKISCSELQPSIQWPPMILDGSAIVSGLMVSSSVQAFMLHMVVLTGLGPLAHSGLQGQDSQNVYTKRFTESLI